MHGRGGERGDGRGIVFDFDGVIVDSEPLHEHACRVALRERGMDFTHEQFVEHCIGHGDRMAFLNLFKLNGREASDDEIAATKVRKSEVFLDGVRSAKLSPQPNAVELIRQSAEAGPIAVCTGSRRVEVEPILDRLGVLGLLETLVTADDVHRTKPDPACYLLAAERLGIAPGACVAIEDTPTGAQAALSAGYRVLAVCTTLPADRHTGAHRVVPDLSGIDVSALLGV